MKFCYIDESGKGEEPVLVMAGIITDAQRMHVTKKDWGQIVSELATWVGRPVEEFHTRDFYRGNSIWRELNGEQRTWAMSAILDWLRHRNHKVVFSAVEKQKADLADFSGKDEFLCSSGRPDYWRVAALHLMLGIQKLHQQKEKNKGNTVMVFDRGTDEEDVAEMSLAPPAWTDSFYRYKSFLGRGKKQRPNPEPRLSQIVDVPYFADSRKVRLLQLADFFAYLIRHHAELQAGLTEEEYSGEGAKISQWVRQIGEQTVSDSYRWPATGGCACSQWFKAIAPDPLLRLCRSIGK